MTDRDLTPTPAPPRTDRVRLAAAGAHFGLTVGSLRAEAKRGRLVIWRVAGKDFTSLEEVDKMFDLCRVEPKERVYGSDPPGRDTRLSGSSRTPDTSAALAAARLKLARMKSDLQSAPKPLRGRRPKNSR